MTEVSFAVRGASPDRAALSPTLIVDLEVEATSTLALHGLAVTCQVQVEPARREHAPYEVLQLTELFGASPRFGRTPRPWVWGRSTTLVGPFRDSTRVSLPVARSNGGEHAAPEELNALEGGDVLLRLLFTGTIFSEAPDHGLAIEPIGGGCVARCRLPRATWRALLDWNGTVVWPRGLEQGEPT